MAMAYSRTFKPEEFARSPIHRAVALQDRLMLSKLLGSLPRLADPAGVMTESESLTQERYADEISTVVDRRDVPHRETPLHLAVRLNDLYAVEALVSAGADPSLHNAAGWNPLQEAVIASRRGDRAIAVLLARYLHRSNWCKFRRRLPRIVAALGRMRDFYMEISFHFESSVVPFVGKVLPSDTYRIWKRDGNLRADTTLAGFDGLKIQRADQSFLFLGNGSNWKSLYVVNRDKKIFFDAFEEAADELPEADALNYVTQSSVARPGMDVTRAELASRTNWRGQEKTEKVGDWKAKVYEVNNVSFSFRTRKVVNEKSRNDVILPLELDEDDDGFLVAENLDFSFSGNSSHGDDRRHSSFVREDAGRRGDIVTVGRKSVDIIPFSSSSSSVAASRLSTSKTNTKKGLLVSGGVPNFRRNGGADMPPPTKEKEFVRNLKPSVWLTEQFPLKTEELLPLLDILSGKVKAIRRMREMLTTKFPQGTFPVKLAIPVVPTVKVVITFTKFQELPPVEQFYTPFSSPVRLAQALDDDEQSTGTNNPSSSSSWLRRNSGKPVGNKHQQDEFDVFTIPTEYKRHSTKSTAGNKGKK